MKEGFDAKTLTFVICEFDCGVVVENLNRHMPLPET